MGINCFLVDDSTPFLEAASKLLEAQGLAVVGVATTSAEALARVRELEPDVTIVDVDLNGESGFDLAWQLAAAPTRSEERRVGKECRSRRPRDHYKKKVVKEKTTDKSRESDNVGNSYR